MDLIHTEVMRNRFAAIVEEASTIAYRSAHTTFVKQTQDYQVALATPEGDIFAYPSMSGVMASIGLCLKPVLDYLGLDNLHPGDVVITNDPFASEGMCTHTMDVHMLEPVFHDGKLIAISWSFIHASDIGGAVPGSISPASTDVYQEGIRLRPVKLYRKGELVREVFDVFMDNCRIPREIWGDLQAMLAAMKTMNNRLADLCGKLGPQKVTQGIKDVLTFAEASARSVISAIPDGTWSFSDYLEGLRPDELTFITASLTIAGDTASVDFTGTDPQVLAAANFISGPHVHPYLVQPLINYVLTMAPHAPANAGLLRAIRSHAPSGTVVNAELPAASGNRFVCVMRVYDVVMGCLNQAVPGALVSCGAGQAGISAVTVRDSRTGGTRVNVINPIIGGSGGRLTGDGVDGVDGPLGFLRNTPVEVVESETSVRVRQYMLVPDTVAPGRWRGGAAIVMDIENVGFQATMTVRGMNRSKFRPWGVLGGHPGALGGAVVNPGTPGEVHIDKITTLDMKRGDLVRLTTPAGGGFGNPLEREPARVLADVIGGWISAPRAEKDYAVVIRDGAVDAAATDKLRAERQGVPLDLGFAMGPEREAYDRIWPAAVRARLASLVMLAGAIIRPHLLAAVRDRLTREGLPVDEKKLKSVIREEYANFVEPAQHDAKLMEEIGCAVASAPSPRNR